MNKFRFKFNTLTWVLLFLVLALTVSGLVWNILGLITYSDYGTLKRVTYILTIILVAFIVALTFGMIFFSCYVIKDGFLYSYFGFIRSKIDIKNITEITHFKKTDKLVIYFDKNKYSVIVISPDLYDKFIESLRSQNKNIVFDARIDGEE